MKDSEKLDREVTVIYNECWKIYREYTAGHDMALYNRRVGELTEKYERSRFLVNILYAFAPVVNVLHGEHLKEEKGC